MKGSIKTLLVALAALMSLVSGPTARAEDTGVIPHPVTGKIEKADRYSSTIVIRYGDGEGDLVTIAGFPFHNLEAQLDEVWYTRDSDADGITIAAGDCVTVEYSVKDLCSEDKVYKWESLTAYCEACITCEDCITCKENITCEESGICEECSICEACIIKAGEAGKCYVSEVLTRIPPQNNRPKP